MRKHPHVRGEDVLRCAWDGFYPETPPRAWGRRGGTLVAVSGHRNTPTCVGKTCPPVAEGRDRRKHPHVRGEDTHVLHRPTEHEETPPRAWGRPTTTAEVVNGYGNTPTCVGKTDLIMPNSSVYGKHPHVRGEDQKKIFLEYEKIETPPRAWGRPGDSR